jgi:hypothetical protein
MIATIRREPSWLAESPNLNSFLSSPFWVRQSISYCRNVMEMLNLLLHNTSAKFPRTLALIFEVTASTFADLSRLIQLRAN